MTPSDAPAVVVVVLAGGASRRFGTDKLDADLQGRTLLARALDGVPDGLPVVVVGPRRTVARPVRFVREDPPGGGPGAALVRGLREALALGAEAVVTLPGDAPRAGAAVPALLARLGAGPAAGAVVGVDPSGREQPLQVALDAAAAHALVELAGSNAGAGESVRRMLAPLHPVRQALEAAAAFDIDTREQAQAWLRDRSPTDGER